MPNPRLVSGQNVDAENELQAAKQKTSYKRQLHEKSDGSYCPSQSADEYCFELLLYLKFIPISTYYITVHALLCHDVYTTTTLCYYAPLLLVN